MLSHAARRSPALARASASLSHRTFFTRMAYKASKSVMPPISETEQVALGCGTIGFDRDIFTGSPSLQHLIDTYKPDPVTHSYLTAEELAFMDNEVNVICGMINDHEVTVKKDMNKETWDYMRSAGFFSMKIPKEWGGKGFSTAAVSAVLSKLATQCTDANATVAVPNSLGPGELLVRYGTPDQKSYFLPRLADGTLIPCFGLTGAHSGSDATSLIGSFGTVEERDGVLGVRATFKKRYITLAPVAGVVGIGIDLKDPNGLLKGDGAEGFTVLLLERGHEGLRMGPRHIPLNNAFMNGTVEGEDVWVPMESILGGRERCGFGWHMFVECLAEGRGVSLPASSIGAGRTLVGAVGAYTRVRKQFRVPIAEFGGIQEALADGASDGLICMAGGDLMNAIVDNHEAPMVVSSIMKQNCTDRGRKIVEKGMDIAAGSAICRGDMNYMAQGYMSLPVAITVEGANIMTRSFQIIGQGLTRCHPHMLELIYSLQAPKEDEEEAVKKFGTQFKRVVGHGLENFALSIGRGYLSYFQTAFRGDSAYTDTDKMIAHHEDQLKRLSANFALTADLCFTLGGGLKFEELLMGRLSDAMGAIFLGYATLHHLHHNRHVEGLNTLAEHALLKLEYEAQEAMYEAKTNFPGKLGGVASAVMGMAGCPGSMGWTRPYTKPKDNLIKEISNLCSKPSQVRDLFTEHVYHAPAGKKHQVSDLMNALPICCKADEIMSECKKSKRQPTEAEQVVVDQAEKLRDMLIQVDVFDHATAEEATPGYVRPALQGTAEMLAKNDFKSFKESVA